MSHFVTIVFALRALLNAPALDDGIDPIMQPVIAHDSALQIDPITLQDIEQVYFRWGIKNEKVLGHTSVRLGLSKTPARFMNILGNVESGISDDLLVLVKSTDGFIGLRVSRVQKIRYKMVQ
jgi:hypothetical protein